MMKNLHYPVLLCAGLIALTGCPGDDAEGGESNGGDAGTSSAGTSGGAVAGQGGTAGKGGGQAGISGDQAAADACNMVAQMPMGGASGAASQCTGFDQYASCIENTCGSAACNAGACKPLVDCYKNASDPCKADCEPSSECKTCQEGVARCAMNQCLSLVMCGKTEAGGACDQLDDCCDTMSGSAKTQCETVASSTRRGGGDQLCMTALPGLCPE